MRSFRSSLVRGTLLAALPATLLAAGGCNVLTGADDVDYVGGGGPIDPANTLVLADGVSVRAIDLYQGVRVPLMDSVAPVGPAPPIVAGRDALLRVHYDRAADYDGQPLRARLTVGEAEPIQIDGMIGPGSTLEALDSTLNLVIPGELVGAGGYQIELLRPASQSSGSNAAARYPAEGQAVVAAHSVGEAVRIVLVPIAYDADGSGRLPDTSEAQLALYRDTLYRLYPAPAIDITVAPAMPWGQAVLAEGAGWNELLDQLLTHRQASGAADDEYYYGIFAPTPDFGSYCGGGCIAGLSMIAGPNDGWSRAGVGIGFSGTDSTETAAHELGHEHGLGHTPCDTWGGVDPAYAPADGSLGVWGYDLLNGVLVDPSTADLMGYCEPTWIGGYHWNLLFQRIQLVNGAAADWARAPRAGAGSYDRILVAPNGQARFSTPLKLDAAPSGEPTAVALTTPTGTVKKVGHFYRTSHLPGGMLLVPATPGASKLSAQLGVLTLSASR